MIDIKRQVTNLVFTAPEQRSARVGLLLRRVEATGQLRELSEELAANGYIVTVDGAGTVTVTTKEKDSS
jgi:alpha-beta hydrolase superfamily lysophospholipase